MPFNSEKKPLVSIVVLNWNGKRFVDSFFDSVDKLSYPKKYIEIIFVDNKSSDDSVDYFLSKKIKNARLVQTGSNYGYAKGNNFGIKESRGDYIAICNNDLEFDSGWLDNLIKTALETRADVVVPKLIFADSKKINNAGSMIVFNSDWPNDERGVNADRNDARFNERAEITAFCGASPLIKRSFFENVGIFDSHFFLYWEDTDLSWRAYKQNKTIIYEPKSTVYHHTSSSTGGSNSPIFNYYVSRNRVLILIKNGSIFYALKAFAKVTRDHVFYKLKDLFIALSQKQNRKVALKNLGLGVRIIGGIIWLSPLMLLKRYNIVKEESL